MLGGAGCSQGGISLNGHASVRIGQRAKQHRGRLLWRHCAGLAAASLGVRWAGLRARASACMPAASATSWVATQPSVCNASWMRRPQLLRCLAGATPQSTGESPRCCGTQARDQLAGRSPGLTHSQWPSCLHPRRRSGAAAALSAASAYGVAPGSSSAPGSAHTSCASEQAHQVGRICTNTARSTSESARQSGAQQSCNNCKPRARGLD